MIGLTAMIFIFYCTFEHHQSEIEAKAFLLSMMNVIKEGKLF